jgi:octaprenyl-diphosphate synthase
LEPGLDRTALDTKFMHTYSEYLKRIDSELEALLRPYSDHPLFGPLSYSLKGGKRLRPLVALLVNEALGKGEEEPYAAAAAIELLHTVSLIHDDYIDRAIQRREAVPYYKEFGSESAFLVADFVLGLILSVSSSYENRRVGEELSRTTIEMSHGEEMERMLVSSGRKVSPQEYLRTLELKTSSLFRASASIGALLSARPEMAVSMGRFGFRLGMAYQLRDDLADMGQEKELSSQLDVGGGDKNEFLDKEAVRNVDLALNELKKLGRSGAVESLRSLVSDYF